MYICPMHPEVRSKIPGKCPKCGMDLNKEEKVKSGNNYTPLIVIIGMIFLVALTIEVQSGLTLRNFISNFMIGFFITFACFKLMDLKGFVEGYFTYDLLAMRFKPYGYLYPFLELLFGLAMILNLKMILVLKLEILVMTFSGLGVAWKLLKKEKFQCACLGTFLKVPLTYVTLVEDFGMAALAFILLLNY